MALPLHMLLLLLLLHFSSSSADPLFNSCGGGNYTANSTYQSNLNQLLSFFTSLNSSFSTHANGSSPDTAYGLILCRGDTSPSDCRVCVQNAALDVLSLCPTSKQATIWYDNCQLRYSNIRFFSLVDNSNPPVLINVLSVTEHPESFIQLQRKLLDKITYQAAYNSSLFFATGTAVNGSDLKVNGLAQCTRDLSNDSCSECLQQIHDAYRLQYTGLEVKQGGRVLAKSCNFRYEIYPFYQVRQTILLNFTTTAPPLPSLSQLAISPQSAVSTGSKDNTKKVLSIVIPIVVVVILLTAVCIFLWRKRAAKHDRSTVNLEKISTVESLSFDLSTLIVATGNFSEENKLGEGGFGPVYKGKLRDGQEIAVKRLSTSSTQGVEELKNEFLLVSKLQHRNLVKLLGICLEEEEKLLVYDYMPNRSLNNLLFDPIKSKHLNWELRFNIIGGIARGLFYLHEESQLKIIHRDLKASNILLDADLTPKISDFGLARLFDGDETQGTTSRVIGTLGYMAPEYAHHGHFSTKVDVFSYGVLTLEIVTGRQSSSVYDSGHAEDFLDYVWEHWSNGTILEIVDPSLETCSKDEVLRCIHVALLCVQEVPDERPSMLSVFVMLHSPSVPLQTPQQPTLVYRNMLSKPTCMDSSDGSPIRSLPNSVNDVSITELQPRYILTSERFIGILEKSRLLFDARIRVCSIHHLCVAIYNYEHLIVIITNTFLVTMGSTMEF